MSIDQIPLPATRDEPEAAEKMEDEDPDYEDPEEVEIYEDDDEDMDGDTAEQQVNMFCTQILCTLVIVDCG
jgi:hypothetical protein